MANKRGQPVIAIDGTSASGKSTLSEQLARQYGAKRLEFSVIFRLIGLHMVQEGFAGTPDAVVTPEQEQEAARFAKELTWEKIEELKKEHADAMRGVHVTRAVPFFSGLPGVIDNTNDIFRALIDSSPKPVVAEGRAIGRHVYPEADVKFFVDANIETRGSRRGDALRASGRDITNETVINDLKRRDHQDQTRDLHPTGFDPEVQTRIDTSGLSIDEMLAHATDIISSKLPKLQAKLGRY